MPSRKTIAVNLSPFEAEQLLGALTHFYSDLQGYDPEEFGYTTAEYQAVGRARKKLLAATKEE